MRILNTNRNIFDLPANNSAVCVTTNGIIKQNGYAVMGKGIALEADRRYGLSKKLGKELQLHGNHVHFLGDFNNGPNRNVRILSFPTKNDWRNNSDLTLIRRSAYELIAACIEHGIKQCYLPPAGCGCGGLDFETQVKPVLMPILDENITGIDFITILRS